MANNLTFYFQNGMNIKQVTSKVYPLKNIIVPLKTFLNFSRSKKGRKKIFLFPDCGPVFWTSRHASSD